jgi:2,3-bisphosphoglycerate-independent phosphoglycerate mutase
MDARVILVIRDGWGFRESCEDNAICSAKTPYADKLMREYPNTLLDASGEAVGLAAGYQGNSEVGHMTIGSGRIIFQSLPRIDKSIESGDFYKIGEFVNAIENCKKNQTTLHIMGLLQSEGVHSHERHLHALLRLCQRENFKNVKIHVFTDGRDAPVKDSIKHIKALYEVISETGVGEIATISGRFYAMDRNKTWDRTRKAYDCIVYGETSREYTDLIEYVEKLHAGDETDEFIVPSKKTRYCGVQESDSMIFFNFRTDRTRQLTQAIVEEDFIGWERKPLKLHYVAMTQFYNPMNAHIAFKDIPLANLLGETISKAGLKQLRISETEKYAHVTFFFNGQVEKPYPGEERALIQSPKVNTYDLKPEMSAYEVSEKLVEEIQKDIYDFIVVNLVNCDMVGHTGDVAAIEKAISAVDECSGKIVDAGLERGYTLMIFADHGHAEDQTPDWRTSHTTNKVPLIIASKNEKIRSAKLKTGMGLKDIAPTALMILGLGKPSEMSGENIIAPAT